MLIDEIIKRRLTAEAVRVVRVMYDSDLLRAIDPPRDLETFKDKKLILAVIEPLNKFDSGKTLDVVRLK